MRTVYVYFIEGRTSVKIGVSVDPDARCTELQTGNQEPLRVAVRLPFRSRVQALNMESRFHRRFASCRIQGEWFRKSVLRKLRNQQPSPVPPDRLDAKKERKARGRWGRIAFASETQSAEKHLREILASDL